uniref:Uncharacterized protein n=1 Tax=Oryza meridionalis TaxID=40149 RepID=A0A0E0C5P4_9ORYZ
MVSMMKGLCEAQRRLGWRWRRGGGHEDDSDDEEGGAYDGNGTGEQALVVLVVSSVAASASTSAAVSGSVPVGLAAKNLKLMHEGAQDLNLAGVHGIPELGEQQHVQPRRQPGGGEQRWWQGQCGRVFSAMELLRSISCYVPLPQMGSLGMPAEYAAVRLHLGEFHMPPPRQQQQQGQTVLDFSRDTHGTGAGGGSGVFGARSVGLQESAVGRLLFPFEDLKPVVSAVAGDANSGSDHQHDHGKNQGGGGGVIGGHKTQGSRIAACLATATAMAAAVLGKVVRAACPPPPCMAHACTRGGQQLAACGDREMR